MYQPQAMAAMGVAGALHPIVIVVELFGGLAVMSGWHKALAAFSLDSRKVS